MTISKLNKIRGFSLIELMIVVVIVAIIASIAYPSYQEQMRKTRRSDAQAALMDAAARMERFYTQFGRYTGTIASAGINATSPENFYQISIATIAAPFQTFTLRATPTAGSAQVNDRCGNLTIDQAQQKDAENSNGLGEAECW